MADKTDKPQQQVLSVRISEALRQRLKRAKQLVESKTGESVSTSEIAKQLLESAREDRLEVVDLMAEPTKALLEIRRKGEAGHGLSKAEWTVLAHFVQQGFEAFSGDTPNPVSRESTIAVLDASSQDTNCERELRFGTSIISAIFPQIVGPERARVPKASRRRHLRSYCEPYRRHDDA